MFNQELVSMFLAELDPYTLETYLQKCLKFLAQLTGNPVCKYLKAELRANLAVALTQALSVSQLKYASATSLSQETMHLLSTVCSNLVTFRTAKEQGADNPLLPTLLQFSQRRAYSAITQQRQNT